MTQRALISVSDKTGIAEFARTLTNYGYEIISTGGTAKVLSAAGVPIIHLSDYTDFPEILGGRVKTLHPKVHGGILARRGNDNDIEEMKKHAITPIDIVIVNLYPFESTITKINCRFEDAIENIDIGGVALLRAAAKNCAAVTTVVDAQDYSRITEALQNNGISESLRRELAYKAFQHTAHYDTAIAAYLSRTVANTVSDERHAGNTADEYFNDTIAFNFEKIQSLNYGENPHQRAAFYRMKDTSPAAMGALEQHHGKKLSFNNIIDINAAYEMIRFVHHYFNKTAAVIVKHTNPCGLALGDTQIEALTKARATDPTSAFGGIIGLNTSVGRDAAEEISHYFIEAVIAPDFTDEALTILTAKKNIRLLSSKDIILPVKSFIPAVEIKTVKGGILVQEWDLTEYDKLTVVTDAKPSDTVLAELKFAWLVSKFVKSNAIVYTRDYQTIGIGAGQMSRVDSAEVALMKAGHAGLSVTGAVMASDAFFPFRDSIDAAAEKGISAIIQPGGSIRDEEVIAAANEHAIPMVFTGMRHFRH